MVKHGGDRNSHKKSAKDHHEMHVETIPWLSLFIPYLDMAKSVKTALDVLYFVCMVLSVAY